jgi:diphosphomevalonate decarboxylase
MTQPNAATIEAAANIAFIKYWGALDLERAVPCNRTLSMTLKRCCSRCSVEFLAGEGKDEIWLIGPDGKWLQPDESFSGRIARHLERLRAWSHRRGRFRVATRNSFPASAGLASSASGFAALTIAATRALGLSPSRSELSMLARLSGSGSAARSVLGGYVEWPAAAPDANAREEEIFAQQVASEDHWDLRDVIAIVESGAKGVSSLEGHRRALTSPFFATRQARLEERFLLVRQAILDRDLATLGPLIEEEAIELHLIAMSSQPPIFYWRAGTLAVLEEVRRMRDEEGARAFATMDAGANVHVICTADDEERIARRLQGLDYVEAVIRDGVGPGPAVLPQGLL